MNVINRASPQTTRGVLGRFGVEAVALTSLFVLLKRRGLPPVKAAGYTGGLGMGLLCVNHLTDAVAKNLRETAPNRPHREPDQPNQPPSPSTQIVTVQQMQTASESDDTTSTAHTEQLREKDVRINSLEQQLIQAEKERARLEKEFNANQKELDRQRTACETAETSRTLLEEGNGKIQSTLDDKIQELEEASNTLEALKREVHRFGEEVSRLQERFDGAQYALTDQRRTSTEQIEQLATEHKETLGYKQDALGLAVKTIEHLKQRVTHLLKQGAENSEEEAECKADGEQWQQSIKEMVARHAQALGELQAEYEAQLQQQGTRYESQLREKDQELTLLSAEARSLLEQHKKTEQRAKELVDVVERLQTALKENPELATALNLCVAKTEEKSLKSDPKSAKHSANRVSDKNGDGSSASSAKRVGKKKRFKRKASTENTKSQSDE